MNKRVQLHPSRISLRSAAFIILLLLQPASTLTQNVVVNGDTEPTAAPVRISRADALSVVDLVPTRHQLQMDEAKARHLTDPLEAHVRQMIEGWPWMPFHHTHGISGYEAYFAHPDQLFVSLSFALPFLSAPTAETARAFLREQLSIHAPFSTDGWEPMPGQPRESYRVPPSLRLSGRTKPDSAYGIYAFWTYCHFADDLAAAEKHWPEVHRRMQPLLAAPYPFDLARKELRPGETQRLNGDLAGLIGLTRLARLLGERDVELMALARLTECLELRINLERMNPRLLERAVATRSLHLFKLNRYSDLTPEVGWALRHWGGDLVQSRIRSFREARPAWWLAFGDRMVGGENYTNPPDFPRALFAASAFIEALPADSLLDFIDVPWCRADLYFIERCAFALHAALGASRSIQPSVFKQRLPLTRGPHPMPSAH
jgi:hypothetical protein